MKKIVLTIKNNSLKNHNGVKLFHYGKAIPEGVDIKVDVVESGKLISEITYSKLIDHIACAYEIVNVLKSTNNRRLYFWRLDAFGGMQALEPDLEIDGTQREVKIGKEITFGDFSFNESDMFLPEYKKQWNPKKWNIADTKEKFYLDFRINVFLDIKKDETFVLEFKIFEMKRVVVPPPAKLKK